VAGVALCACTSGTVSEVLSPVPFQVTVVSKPSTLIDAPGFADQRGGGVFVDTLGRAVRVRSDGSTQPLESHPGNTVVPGAVRAVWPLGPFSALVGTATGLFVAESGWLISPPWQSLLGAEGFIGTALDQNGIAWLAHDSGLFRLEGGQLFELTANGAPLTGITTLAVAPGPSGGEAVWFGRVGKLQLAERHSASGYLIKGSGLAPEDIKGGVLTLAGLTPSPKSPGELWAVTAARALWRFTRGVWVRYDIGRQPEQLLSAGRFTWLRAGESLFRYDADAQVWGEAQGLAPGVTFQSVDAAGAAWVRDGSTTQAIADGWVPRLTGLFQDEQVYGTEALITVHVPTVSEVLAVTYRVDDGLEQEARVEKAVMGEGAQAGNWSFSLGGADAFGPKPFSLVAYNDGLHTLDVTALFLGGNTATRRVHFELKAGLSGTVSWAADIKPIFEARCAHCHTSGPGRDFTVYEAWQRDNGLIVAVVKEKRMPADGPLDPVLIGRIVRWANGGMLP
jgi:hypothetical protein